MKKEDIDVFFKGRNLTRAYDQYAEQFGGTYPPVKNPDALMRGIRDLMGSWAEMSDGDPGHITMGIYEVKEVNVRGQRRKARKTSDYVISVNDLAEEYGEPGYEIREVRFSDDQVESLSVIEPQAVHWSPDTIENTDDETRTKYYIGFIYQICDHSTGYDQELSPELEIDAGDLMSYLVAGSELPADVQQKAHESQMAKAEQEAIIDSVDIGYDEEITQTATQKPSYNSIFAYDPEEVVEAEVERPQQEETQLPWEEPKQVEEQRQTQSQDQSSYFFDDTNASFEELDLDEEELEDMFS